MNMRFDEIILFERYTEGFLGAAMAENLVKFKKRRYIGEAVEKARRSNYKQRALEMYTLFDKVHLRNAHPDISFPSLQHAGYITVDCRHMLHLIELTRDMAGGPDKVLEKHGKWLKDIYYVKPLIMNTCRGKAYAGSLKNCRPALVLHHGSSIPQCLNSWLVLPSFPLAGT